LIGYHYVYTHKWDSIYTLNTINIITISIPQQEQYIYVSLLSIKHIKMALIRK